MALGTRIVRNSLWNVAALLVTLAVNFLTIPILLSILGPSRYGLMVILSAAIIPLGLATLNFGQATIKYVAESHARADLQRAGLYLRTTTLFNIFVGVAGTVLILLLAGWLTTSVFKIELADQGLARECLYWLAFGWTLNMLGASFAGVPAAFQRYDILAIGNVVYSVCAAVASLTAVYVTHDLLHYVEARVVVQALGVVMWVFVARGLLPGVRLHPGWNQEAFRRSLRFGSWQTLGDVTAAGAGQADKYVLGVMLSTAAVGFYNVAMTLQQQAYTVGMKVGEVLFPAFSYQTAAADVRREADLLMRATWLLTTLSVGIMVPVIVLGGDFVRLWVGPAVAASSAPVLRVLALAGLLGSASNAAIYYLLGIGRTKWLAGITFATAITIVTGSVVLVPRFGLAGAGWGNVGAMGVQAVCVTAAWRRLFGTVLPMRVYLAALYDPAIVGLCAAGVLIWMRGTFAVTPGWFLLAVGVAICGAATIVPIAFVDRWMPGGERRREDVTRLAQAFSRFARAPLGVPGNGGPGRS